VEGEAEITGGVRAGLTVTATALEVTITGVPALSVTWSSKFQVPVVERTPVDTEGVDEVVQLKELPRLL
jgi:hypothetical protein